MALAIFTTYVLISPDNVLTPQKAFVTLTYTQLMSFYLNILPEMVYFLAQVSEIYCFNVALQMVDGYRW